MICIVAHKNCLRTGHSVSTFYCSGIDFVCKLIRIIKTTELNWTFELVEHFLLRASTIFQLQFFTTINNIPHTSIAYGHGILLRNSIDIRSNHVYSSISISLILWLTKLSLWPFNHHHHTNFPWPMTYAKL